MAQAVSCLPVIAKARLRSQPVHVTFVLHKVALRQAFLQYFRFPPSVSFHQHSILNFIYILLYQKDKRAKPDKFKKKFLSESGQQ